MHLLFGFIICFTLAITGAVIDSRRVVVKEGQDAILVVETHEMGNLNRVELQAHSENGAIRRISLYCSPEEEKSMCGDVQPKRTSLRQGYASVTLPNVSVSDAGQYVVEVIGSNFTKKQSFTLIIFPESSGDQSITGSAVGILIILIIVIAFT